MEDTYTIFILNNEDVIGCAQERGIPGELITEDIHAQVKNAVEWGLESWSNVVKAAFPSGSSCIRQD